MNYKNYKVLISTLLSLSVMACSEVFKPFEAWQTVDHFEVQEGLVIDTRTGLMWSRCVLGATWNGNICQGSTYSYSWQQAENLVKTLNYQGYADWRIPTLEELKSLANKEASAPMVRISDLNQNVFPTPNCVGTEKSLNGDARACWQWSSTPIEGSDHYAWIVNFGYGYGSANYQTDMFPLRLVRDK